MWTEWGSAPRVPELFFIWGSVKRLADGRPP